jgi:hypothetical protein
MRDDTPWRSVVRKSNLAPICFSDKNVLMSLEQIQAELSELPQDQQDRVAAYLVHLRHKRDPSIRGEITRRIDDKDPAHWVSLEELEEKWKE